MMIKALEGQWVKGSERQKVLKFGTAWGFWGVLGLFLVAGRRCPRSQSFRWQARLVLFIVFQHVERVWECGYDGCWRLATFST